MMEKQLIEGCKRGDRKAQKELYEMYSRKMMGVCLRYIGDRETARDLLQDGFIKVFTSIFVNCALEYLRKSDVLRESVGFDLSIDQIGFDDLIISEISASELLKLVQDLPNSLRAVFNLFAIEGYSHKEVAKMMDISESTSRSQYVRAKQLLQSRINELYGLGRV